ncbi:MAG: phosphatidylglycerophosphatase A [Pirellulales bacterium]|nr:phosphatidylglycerophosphatase A [Pirellulales bacterium]
MVEPTIQGRAGKRPTTPAILAATVLGVGWLRPAPGTWGSLAGLPLAWLVVQIPDAAGVPAVVIQAVVASVIFAIGIPICTAASRQLGIKDPGMVVYDEWAAMPFVFLLVPQGNPWIWLAGFGLFRLFDISKPPPIKKLEKLGEGLGVMIDDLMAAVYANVALQLLVRLGPLSAG